MHVGITNSKIMIARFTDPRILDKAFIYTEDFQNEIYRKGFSIRTQLSFLFLVITKHNFLVQYMVCKTQLKAVSS